MIQTNLMLHKLKSVSIKTASQYMVRNGQTGIDKNGCGIVAPLCSVSTPHNQPFLPQQTSVSVYKLFVMISFIEL